MASKDLPNKDGNEEPPTCDLPSDASCHIRKNFQRSLEQNDQADEQLNVYRRGIKSDRANATKTTDDLPEEPPLVLPQELANTLSAEQIQAAADLWQANPRLSTQFSTVVDFCQLWCVQPQCYELLDELLNKIQSSVQDLPNLVIGGRVAQFAGNLGFAEKTCSLYQQAMQEEGIQFFSGTEEPSQQSGDTMRCLYNVRCVHLRFTHRSLPFGQLLAKSGMLSFLVEDLKHMYRNNHYDLAESSLFLQSVGCLHNCCRNPDTLRIVRAMDVVKHLSPYLSSYNTKVKMMVLMTLAHVVEEHQNDLLASHSDVMGFLLEQLALAWDSERHHHDFFCVEELLHALRYLAKLDSNKTALLEKGVLQTLLPVLRDGSDTEKLRVAGVLWELSFNQHNSQIIQSSLTLGSLLEGLKKSGHSALSDRASKTLWTVERKTRKEDGQQTVRYPSLDELLQPLQNAMQLLDVGPVEMAVNQLNVFERQGQAHMGTSSFCTRAQLLNALFRLSRDEEKNAREFVEKGGFPCLTKIMQPGKAEEEERECAMAILRLLITRNFVKIDKQADLWLIDELSKKTRAERSDQLAPSGHAGPSEVAWSRKGVDAEVCMTSVYISCHPQDLSLARRVRDYLQIRHYDVRVAADATSDHDSPRVEDMARAIRSCTVVLLCVSQRYKASAHCRMEVEYADELKKDLVALLVEVDYQPSGWLANLLAKVKVVVDVTDAKHFDQNLGLLENMLNSASPTSPLV